jgi:hypothetical protein
VCSNLWNRGLCCEKVAATVASIAASPRRPARTQFSELPGTQRLAKWQMRYFLVCRTWRTLADSVTGRPQPSFEVTNPKTRSTTFFNDLPCVNQRGLYTERHLQPDTFCRLSNSWTLMRCIRGSERCPTRKLREFGKVARYMVSPTANMGNPPLPTFVLQLEEARAEWRRQQKNKPPQ